MPWRPALGPAWTTFAASAVGFAVLGLCVGQGAVDAPDRWVRDVARPRDVWGPAQIRSEHVVNSLRPVTVAAFLAVATAVVCLSRRTLRPAVLAVGASAAAVVVTALVKVMLVRPDPRGGTSGHGGSFPSGHTTAVVVCIGLVLFVLRPQPRPWQWLVCGAVGLVMGTALVVEAMHWGSDVVGGMLLGVAVLSVARATGFVAWSASRPDGGRRPAAPGRPTSTPAGGRRRGADHPHRAG
jgi:membrane-associated phospholipid phosphatase